MSVREIKIQPSKIEPSPWPRGDATLKRLLDLKYTRSRIAEELSRELRMRISDDQVTNRGKRKGWIIVSGDAARLPKGMTPITPQRLGAIIAGRVPVKRAKTCQEPMWHDKYDESGEPDPAYGRFCEAVCDEKSSYCAEHRAINVATVYMAKSAEAYAARRVAAELDRIAYNSAGVNAFKASRVVRAGELAPRDHTRLKMSY